MSFQGYAEKVLPWWRHEFVLIRAIKTRQLYCGRTFLPHPWEKADIQDIAYSTHSNPKPKYGRTRSRLKTPAKIISHFFLPFSRWVADRPPKTRIVPNIISLAKKSKNQNNSSNPSDFSQVQNVQGKGTTLTGYFEVCKQQSLWTT